MTSDQRLAIAAFLLVAATIFLHASNGHERLPAHLPLGSFPIHLDDWSGSDVAIPKDSLDVLGPGDFLLRDYRNKSASVAPTSLFIAFFASQRAGDTIHSPKNCLPGSGWYPLESSRIMMSVPGLTPFPVNRYVIAKGNDRELVLYWYWAHGRGVASEYWAKYYLVSDSIRMHRSDGSLVRVTTYLGRDETPDQALQRLLSFAGTVVPLLNEYIPR